MDKQQPVDLDSFEGAIEGPWVYRPYEHDDWGMVRSMPNGVCTVGQPICAASTAFVTEDEKIIAGMPGSAGVVEGKARVILDIQDVNELGEDEILITHTTTPDWGPVFIRLKGIVTDGGGVMSHAAIVAREYAIPCVVGTSSATQAITTGDMI